MTHQFNVKLGKVADEFANFDLFKPKPQPGPHFRTQETQSMFIITVQLKGYTRTNIKVESNEDRNIIKISGQKAFQDTLMVGRKLVKQDIEMRGFQKWFKVPQGVILDQVNARFNENDSELVIRMPKVTKGFVGALVEELKAEEIQAEPTILLQVYTNEELLEQDAQKVGCDNEDKISANNSKEVYTNEELLEQDRQKVGCDNNEDKISAHSKEDDDEKPKSRPRKFKICKPLMFGSAFVISLIVLVFHLVESKKQENPRKKKNED